MPSLENELEERNESEVYSYTDGLSKTILESKMKGNIPSDPTDLESIKK